MAIKAYFKIILMPALLAIMLALEADATALESGSSQSLRADPPQNPNGMVVRPDRSAPPPAKPKHTITADWDKAKKETAEAAAKVAAVKKQCEKRDQEAHKVMYEKNLKNYEKTSPSRIKACIELTKANWYKHLDKAGAGRLSLQNMIQNL